MSSSLPLSIGSEVFMRWGENFKRGCEARGEPIPCSTLSIGGSTSLTQTGFALLYPNWTSLLAKTIVSPHRVLRLWVTTTLDFPKIAFPRENNVEWVDERLLERGAASHQDSNAGAQARQQMDGGPS